jgi:hypothetical protein
MPAMLGLVHSKPMANHDNRQQRLDEDLRRSFNHENKNKPSGEPPLKLKKSEPKQLDKDTNK